VFAFAVIEQYIRSMNINTQVLDDQHTQKCSKDETSKGIKYRICVLFVNTRLLHAMKTAK